MEVINGNNYMKMVSHIELELRKAYKSTDGAVKTNLLEQLFTSLSKEIDSRILSDVLSKPPEDIDFSADLQYYYQLISPYYAAHPESSLYLMKSSEMMWSYAGYTMVYAMLFHDFILEKYQEDGEMGRNDPEYRAGVVKHMGLLAFGCERLFRQDLAMDQKKFLPIFFKLVETLRKPVTYVESVPSIINVVGKFFLYYGLKCSLHELIEDISYALNESKFGAMQAQNIHAESCTGSERETSEETEEFKQIVPQLSFSQLYFKIADLLTIQAVDTIRDIHLVETVQAYIENFRLYKEVQLSPKTKNRIQMCLHMLTHPGAPYFVPREVYHIAASVLDFLFPTGRWIRTSIRYVFRLIHPYYWPKVASNIFYAFFVTFLFCQIIARVLPRTYNYLSKKKYNNVSSVLMGVLGAVMYFWVDIIALLICKPYKPDPVAN